MILLTIDEIIELHSKLISRTGGSGAELIQIGLAVADGTADYSVILHWITQHKV